MLGMVRMAVLGNVHARYLWYALVPICLTTCLPIPFSCHFFRHVRFFSEKHILNFLQCKFSGGKSKFSIYEKSVVIFFLSSLRVTLAQDSSWLEITVSLNFENDIFTAS